MIQAVTLRENRVNSISELVSILQRAIDALSWRCEEKVADLRVPDWKGNEYTHKQIARQV